MCLFSVKLLKEVSVFHTAVQQCRAFHYFRLSAVHVYEDLFDHDHLTKCLLNRCPSIPCAIVHDVPARMTGSLDNNSLHCTYLTFMWYFIRIIIRHFLRYIVFLFFYVSALDSEMNNKITFPFVNVKFWSHY